MNSEALLRELDAVEAFARAGRWSRFFRIGPRYWSAMTYRFLIYPWHAKGWLRPCRLFWGESFQVLLPAALDLYLLGAKTHLSEIKLARYLIRELRPGDACADIGAHMGYFSRLMAHCCGPSGRVIAFEPTPSTYGILKENTSAIAQITAVHAAVGAVAGQAIFNEYPLKYSEYNTLSETADMPGLPAPRRHQVDIVAASGFFEQAGIQPRIIKIDVEGGEWQVIQGLAPYLRLHQPDLVVELIHREPYLGHFGKIRELMEGIGYTLYIIGEKGQLAAITDPSAYLREEGLDSDNFVFRWQHPGPQSV